MRKIEVGDIVRFTPEYSCCLPLPTESPIGVVQEVHKGKDNIYMLAGYPYMVETEEGIECYAEEEIELLKH